MSVSNQAKTRRIAVLGARAVGKSSLVIQFCENHFVDSYYPTIENTFTKTIKYRGSEYSVEIMDTAGQKSVPCVVVGNKSDLNIQRQISTEEGKELAQQWNCPTIETSAKHDENVSKIFDLLIAQIEKANKAPIEGKGGCIIA
ncbi:hypothetical protein RO3G_00157 [Rhizopus delemar RA 99-880]|uniref:Uncharacterized protein n=1 Tax=Rhizopus delemar (strain RA 99-880 / ATCC MYA-4621 / FGSC 9543 / NRRL 43880) TaxID=246409 RepID=I1BGX3_RHIO9|nr:hypothetical protein RO3G_00157 [Rhizopus delemar RA 99-880]|eukprot:EIE75453.1 hypothetical protein RO3G_00157 [Rhizopus delemar RA 99-880]